jgi:Rieske Fe-S protein
MLMGAGALAAGGGLVTMLEGCAVATGAVTVTLAVDASTLAPGVPIEAPFTLTTSGGTSVAGSTWLVRQQDGSVVAFDPHCTHAQCRYHWAPDTARFKCNCHAGEFALSGSVLAGPPPRPLGRFPVHVSGTTVSVDVPGDFQAPRESLGA